MLLGFYRVQFVFRQLRKLSSGFADRGVVLGSKQKLILPFFGFLECLFFNISDLNLPKIHNLPSCRDFLGGYFWFSCWLTRIKNAAIQINYIGTAKGRNTNTVIKNMFSFMLNNFDLFRFVQNVCFTLKLWC